MQDFCCDEIQYSKTFPGQKSPINHQKITLSRLKRHATKTFFCHEISLPEPGNLIIFIYVSLWKLFNHRLQTFRTTSLGGGQINFIISELLWLGCMAWVSRNLLCGLQSEVEHCNYYRFCLGWDGEKDFRIIFDFAHI